MVDFHLFIIFIWKCCLKLQHLKLSYLCAVKTLTRVVASCYYGNVVFKVTTTLKTFLTMCSKNLYTGGGVLLSSVSSLLSFGKVSFIGLLRKIPLSVSTIPMDFAESIQ